MGLHLCYELALPRETPATAVADRVRLLHCHTTLVALLEEAIRLGFDVTVRDETHYWETRDTNVLLAEVREMNRVVAQFAGALHDAVGGRADGGGDLRPPRVRAVGVGARQAPVGRRPVARLLPLTGRVRVTSHIFEATKAA